MKRLSELAVEIRDCQLNNLKLNWVDSPMLEIVLLRDRQVLKIILEGVSRFIVFEDEFESHCISHIKCLIDEEGFIWISLDPFDERVNEIEESDNFVIKFKNYTIEKS